MPLAAAPTIADYRDFVESYNSGSGHTLRCLANNPLPAGATSMVFRVYDVSGSLFYQSADLTNASGWINVPAITSIGYRGYLQWFSKNGTGETAGPQFGFDLNPTDFPELFGETGPLIFTDAAPELDSPQDGDNILHIASITCLGASIADIGYDASAAFLGNPGTDFARLHVKEAPDDTVNTGIADIDVETIETTIGIGLISPAPLVWMLGNSHGLTWGPQSSIEFVPVLGVRDLALIGATFLGARWHTEDATPAFEWRTVFGPQTERRLLIRVNAVGGATLYDSGFITSGEPIATCLVDLDPGDYIASVTVKKAGGETSVPATLTFIVDEEGGGGGGGGGGEGYCCPPGWTYSVELARCVRCGSSIEDAPEVPAAPALTKVCTIPKIVVTAPAWDDSDEHPTQTMELQRRVNAGSGFGVWETVHIWDSPAGTYNDTDVAWFSAYEYRVRGCNDTGCSAWSATASLALQSGMTIAWLSPAALSTLSVRQDLRFQLTDDSEPDECDDPVGCSDDDPEITLLIDGMAATIDLVRESGTARNGIYKIKRFDTRDYANGPRTLTLEAIGVDCCRAHALRDFVFNNTLRRGTLYFEEQYQSAPPAGQEYGKAEILMQNEALYDHPARRYWVRMGLTALSTDLVNWQSLALDPLAKAEAFDNLQALTAEAYQHGTTPERTQVGAYVPLLVPGPELYLVQQWNPVEVLTTYLTGMTVGAVRSIRRYSNGLYHVFASKDDGSAAKLFAFDYETGLTELLDLSEHSAADALDCVRVNDKYFVVRPAEVFTIDTDAGEIEMPTDPRGETRLGRFVVTLPAPTGESYISLGLYIDDELESEQTAAYDLTYKSPKLLWTLDEVVNAARFELERLMIACAEKLYSTADIADAPTLLHTFGDEIVSLGFSDETWLVGLADGHIWALVEDEWVDRGAIATPALALSGWEGAGEDFYDVAGGDSPQLFERVLAGGLWSDLRTIEAAEEEDVVVTQITALARYEKITREALGTPGQPGFVPEEKIIGLLIGTAPDGALLLLELSPITAASALLASKMSHYALEGFETPVAVS